MRKNAPIDALEEAATYQRFGAECASDARMGLNALGICSGTNPHVPGLLRSTLICQEASAAYYALARKLLGATE